MTDTNAVTDPTTRDASPARPARHWWWALAAGVAAATAVNLAILLVAWLADATLLLRAPGAAADPITVGGVIFSSVVPMTGGIVLASLLARWWGGFLRLAQFVGGGLALLTVAGPLTADTDPVTRTALVTMHLVVGICVVATLEMIRRRRSPNRAGTVR